RMRTSAETGRTVRRERGQTARPTIFPMAALLAQRSLYFRFLRNCYRQRKQINKTFGILRVVTRHRKTGEAPAIQRIGRDSLGDGDIALVELQADRPSHALLGLREIRVQRFALRSKPCTVVH